MSESEAVRKAALDDVFTRYGVSALQNMNREQRRYYERQLRFYHYREALRDFSSSARVKDGTNG